MLLRDENDVVYLFIMNFVQKPTLTEPVFSYLHIVNPPHTIHEHSLLAEFARGTLATVNGWQLDVFTKYIGDKTYVAHSPEELC